MSRILITGGAGFVGSYLVKNWKNKFPTDEIFVFDNLRRRGSELNLKIFQEMGVTFHHGDIRSLDDLMALPGDFDLMIEASAEASVLAGQDGSSAYVINTNLNGTINCLEFMRKRCKKMIFLSTSRVYSIKQLRNISLVESSSRLELSVDGSQLEGLTENGISEKFSTRGYRSLYGATKLSSEQIIEEYIGLYDLEIIINRLSNIAGAGQWGKVDQGVFTYWMAKHYYKGNLNFTGFGGKGFQVRDLLHPSDLFLLICKQVEKIGNLSGEIYNIGGGKSNSVSLAELTQHCQSITGNEVKISSDSNTNPMDIPYFVSDFSKAEADFDWSPVKKIEDILSETYLWLRENEKILFPLFMDDQR